MTIGGYGDNLTWVLAQVTTKTTLYIEMCLITYFQLASFTWNCTDIHSRMRDTLSLPKKKRETKNKTKEKGTVEEIIGIVHLL